MSSILDGNHLYLLMKNDHDQEDQFAIFHHHFQNVFLTLNFFSFKFNFFLLFQKFFFHVCDHDDHGFPVDHDYAHLNGRDYDRVYVHLFHVYDRIFYDYENDLNDFMNENDYHDYDSDDRDLCDHVHVNVNK